MDQLTGELLGLAIWLVGGLLWCGVATLAARRQRARNLWVVWAVLVGGVSGLVLSRFASEPFARGLGIGRAVLMVALLLGVPSALATWAALHRARREPRGRLLLDFLLAVGILALGIVAGSMVLVIPDVVALMHAGS